MIDGPLLDPRGRRFVDVRFRVADHVPAVAADDDRVARDGHRLLG